MTKQTSHIAQFEPLQKSRGRVGMHVCESGSPAVGWKGKGKLIFNFLKLTNNLAIQIPISVKFEGIKINQCYQLYSGTVITEYDPSWSSVADVSMVLDRLNTLLAEIKDLLANATENAALLRQKVTELRNARADINTGDFTQEYKTEQLAAYDRAITGMVCLVGDHDIPTGSRISANSSTQSCDVTTVTADLDNLDNKAENSSVNKWKGDVFDSSHSDGRISSESDDTGNYIIIKSQIDNKISYDLLSMYILKNSHSENSEWKIPIIKLMKYYLGIQQGIAIPSNLNYDLGKSESEDPADVYMYFKSINKTIYLNIYLGFTKFELNHKFIFQNTITHEYYHYDTYFNNFKYGNSNQAASNLVHAYVCFLQVKHNSIKKTPDYWKMESIYRIAEYLKYSENDEPFTRLNKLPLLLEEINKTLQKDFKLKIEKDIDEKTNTYYYRVK